MSNARKISPVLWAKRRRRRGHYERVTAKHRPPARILRDHVKYTKRYQAAILQAGHRPGRWTYNAGRTWAYCLDCHKYFVLFLNQSACTVVARCPGPWVC